MSSITPTVKPIKESEGKEQYLSEIQKILEAASAPIKPIDHIWTSIFLGNSAAARDISLLCYLKVTHVLNPMAEEAVNNQVDPAVYTGLHMNYKGFKVLDDPSFDISSFLEPTKVCPLMVEFWFSAQRVSTYLMLYYKMSLKEAVYTAIRASTPTLDGEHRGHQVETLNEASEKKKEELRNVLAKLTSKREETEKRVQSLQERRREVRERAAGETERVAALIRDIRGQLEALEKRALSEISRYEKQVSLKASDLIQQLEIKTKGLSRKIQDIEELCNTTDPLTVLQERESDHYNFCDADEGDNNDKGRDDKKLRAVDLDEGLISVILHTGLAGIVTSAKRRLDAPQASDILLDVNTAGNLVDVSGDLKTVSRSKINQGRPETPERFQDEPQVLSTRSFSSGRHYWEVEVSELGEWVVGMAYPSIDRRGRQSLIGYNKKSWGLRKWSGDQYLVTHDSKVIQLPHRPSCQRLGIFLDYAAGRLSFYELCDPVRHLHTFTATFTEPLHAVLWVGDEDWSQILFNNACIRIRSWDN